MPDERSHPLLQQTPLSVNPFIDLPKPPTLPPSYTTLPFSTLPPSVLSVNTTTANSNPTTTSSHADSKPPYVTSSTGSFSAHPSTIIAQNQALLTQLAREADEGRKKVEAWEERIRQRELQERRRKAPGWLDREERILQPERKGKEGGDRVVDAGLMDRDEEMLETGKDKDEDGLRTGRGDADGDAEVDGLGEAMDRAFGRSEMG